MFPSYKARTDKICHSNSTKTSSGFGSRIVSNFLEFFWPLFEKPASPTNHAISSPLLKHRRLIAPLPSQTSKIESLAIPHPEPATAPEPATPNSASLDPARLHDPRSNYPAITFNQRRAIQAIARRLGLNPLLLIHERYELEQLKASRSAKPAG